MDIKKTSIRTGINGGMMTGFGYSAEFPLLIR